MNPRRPTTLEICVDTAAGIATCQADADRIELCSALEVGGLTPGPGLIAAAQTSQVPVFAMIRPRAGDFTFDAMDKATCLDDIAAVRKAGLAGVVLGASVNDKLDHAFLSACIAAAGDMGTTLHRVIDTLPDPVGAVEDAITLGFDRILTSGGALNAADGADVIAQMQRLAGDRIAIMAGSGVNDQNVAAIASTGIRSFHASCGTGLAQDSGTQALGFASATRRVTDASAISRLKRAVQSL